jgi:hypothetical protein
MGMEVVIMYRILIAEDDDNLRHAERLNLTVQLMWMDSIRQKHSG